MSFAEKLRTKSNRAGRRTTLVNVAFNPSIPSVQRPATLFSYVANLRDIVDADNMRA
jgi:hypothetical protein